jgi:hypothetical protein
MTVKLPAYSQTNIPSNALRKPLANNIHTTRFGKDSQPSIETDLAFARVNDANRRDLEQREAELLQKREQLTTLSIKLRSLEDRSKSNFGDDLAGPLKVLTYFSEQKQDAKKKHDSEMTNRNGLFRMIYQLLKREGNLGFVSWGEFKTHYDVSRHDFLNKVTDELMYLDMLRYKKGFTDNGCQIQITDLGQQYVEACAKQIIRN